MARRRLSNAGYRGPLLLKKEEGATLNRRLEVVLLAETAD
jgi:hypothetical protein